MWSPFRTLVHRSIRSHGRHLLAGVLALGLASCDDRGALAPGDPQLARGGVNDVACPDDFPAPGSGSLAGQIATLFDGSDESQALKKCQDIAWQVEKGNEASALEQAVGFRDWAQGMAVDDAGLAQLLADLFAFAGFTVPPAAFGEDGFVEIVNQDGGTVVCASLLCGIEVPPGAFDGPTVLSASPIEMEFGPGAGPLPTPLTQVPRFYDFDASSDVNPGFLLTFGVCVDDAVRAALAVPEARIRLAHPVSAEPWRIEILPLAAADFVNCDGPSTADGSLIDQLWSRLAGGLGRLTGPRPLHAAALRPGPLGGLAGSFSPFGAVDVEGTHKTYGTRVGYEDRWLAEDLGTALPSSDGQGDPYYSAAFDEGGLSLTRAPFGDQSAFSAATCPSLDAGALAAGTDWGIGSLTSPTHLLLRARVSLHANATNVRVWAAIDNDLRVFWNGTEITGSLVSTRVEGLPKHISTNDAPIDEGDGGPAHHTEGVAAGFQQHEGCAWEDDIAFSVDAAGAPILHGDNLLVILARDRGGLSWADFRVTAELGELD